jgi:long-chain acyl-CoA synthetase
MFHAASMFGVLGGPAQGAHTVIVPMFEPTAVMKPRCVPYQPTTTVMVPTMIGMTMAHPDFTPDGLGSFTDLVYGASPMPQALLEKLLALYPSMNIWQGYGMTESSSVLTFLGPDEHRSGRHVPALRRQAAAGCGALDPGRRRQPAARRRARRGVRSCRQLHDRVLEQALSVRK